MVWKEKKALSVIAVLAIVLGVALLFNEVFKRLNLPSDVGQILGD
ncbi:MAG: hypothetical protein OEY22_08485 [Candidatus Bathyarchaeota archaeon]|nr:hypothetical protein [Candidatus Bathyarchaeota archaeon]MDH5787878.1 hypothetical protein [Candidatus Bathyarchaeota archaeon]